MMKYKDATDRNGNIWTWLLRQSCGILTPTFHRKSNISGTVMCTCVHTYNTFYVLVKQAQVPPHSWRSYPVPSPQQVNYDHWDNGIRGNGGSSSKKRTVEGETLHERLYTLNDLPDRCSYLCGNNSQAFFAPALDYLNKLLCDFSNYPCFLRQWTPSACTLPPETCSHCKPPPDLHLPASASHPASSSKILQTIIRSVPSLGLCLFGPTIHPPDHHKSSCTHARTRYEMVLPLAAFCYSNLWTLTPSPNCRSNISSARCFCHMTRKWLDFGTQNRSTLH